MLLYLFAGLLIGIILGWFIAKANKPQLNTGLSEDYIQLDKEFTAFKATSEANLKNAENSLAQQASVIKDQSLLLENAQSNLSETKEQLGITTASYKTLTKILEAEKEQSGAFAIEMDALNSRLNKTHQELSTANANHKGVQDLLDAERKTVEALKAELKLITSDLYDKKQLLATSRADNKALTDKLESQKAEMEAMGKKFNTEFEVIANKILETKSEKFTELNKTNLKSILDPLGENLKEFKTKVEEVYDKESKERFSLGEKVKHLSELNQMISEDAKNLTKALKGEAKTQGNWGEMILESILERSGLVKDREYFMEHELKDEDGKPLRSDSEGKKMRPDAVIKYPDNRSVIIDSKVSLTAFTRLIAAIDVDEQQKELAAHVSSLKTHIVSLSAKGYDDYNKSLDFVMLFVPSEPAYIAALQSDPDLWNFAYDKRILLLSPTNLITSLKLIVDLWKREYQNQNAIEIAERGAKLYDKFVGFVENLNDVGNHLNRAKGKYDEAFKQLSTGSDNLVIQTKKLKDLGLKTKKSIPLDLVNSSESGEALGN